MKAKLFPKGVHVSKRLFDLLLTIPGLILISPILLIIALLVIIFHGFPITFSQIRPGLFGQPFTMFKYRSMTDKRDSNGDLLPDEERLTLFGKFIRSTSLDELPELINVLRGEMSLVGPRPLLMRYLDRYNQEQSSRHNVLPGISGWAQINGRNNVSWEAKFELDVWYVNNWSIWLDIRILFSTFWKVITREGINQPGNATAFEFMGTHSNKNNQGNIE